MTNGAQHPGKSTPTIEPAPFLDILYAEDFDEPGEPGEPDQPEQPPPPELLTQADLDAACATAVQAARAGWETSQLALRTQALGALAAGIADARSEARQEAASVAEGTVATMLAMLAGALPALCRTHGDAEVRALMQHLLPALQRESRVVVRVAAALVPVLQRDIALLDEDLAETVTVTPAPLPAGDVRVTWTDGSFARDTDRILTAMQDALAQLGLFNPTTQRRMALAE